MDISHRGPDYEVPKATVDGEPHEVIVLVAVVTGAILASIILLILIAMIERSKKKPQNAPIKSVSTNPSPESTLEKRSRLNQSISTISDRVSMTSEKSYCSGVLVDGQIRCCQKIVGKSNSNISISSGISSGSSEQEFEKDSVKNENVPKVEINYERELKMTRPKAIPTKEVTSGVIEIVTKC